MYEDHTKPVDGVEVRLHTRSDNQRLKYAPIYARSTVIRPTHILKIIWQYVSILVIRALLHSFMNHNSLRETLSFRIKFVTTLPREILMFNLQLFI